MAISLKPPKVVAIRQRVLSVFVYLIPPCNPRLFSTLRKRRCKSTKIPQHTQRAYWGLLREKLYKNQYFHATYLHMSFFFCNFATKLQKKGD